MIDTKTKILDTAERLFGEQGFAAVSLRHIIAEAGVNLAAIHYHFGSKEELLLALVIRKVGPVNDERLAMLSRFEEEHGSGPVPLEQVVEAFLLPAFLTMRKSPEFVRMMGRLHAEGAATDLFMKHFEPLITRFRTALQRALPELSGDEMHWRSHFMVGAMAHALTGPPHTKPDLECAPRDVARRLIAFVCAGMRAPVTEMTSGEERE